MIKDLFKKLKGLKRKKKLSKEAQAELDKDKGVISIAYIAAKHGLETQELEELGISDVDVLDKIATKLAAAKPKEEAKEVEGGGEGSEEGEEEVPFVPDSSEGTGGVGRLTDEQIAKMTPEQYAEHPSVKARFK